MTMNRFLTPGIVVIVGMLSLSSCQRPLPARSQDPPTTEHIKMHTQQTNTIVDGDEVFFILHSQLITPATSKLPDRFYVRGIYKEGRFHPKGGVLGIGDLASQDSGRYGWLELNSKQFFPMESDRKAMTPFVKGYMMKDSNFVPSERIVFDSP